ncbi:unnamed protein product [Amoebophrya sp. A120]|nr:unnamed protein product [Amoebophrya sp. A120]|eukprot:GSA120T00018589001.1
MATARQLYAVSCECPHGLRIEVDWQPGDDVTASLFIDHLLVCQRQNPFSTSSSGKWMHFPVRVRDLPLTARINFQVVRENGGIYETVLHLFQPDAVLKQGRQLLILRDPLELAIAEEQDEVDESNGDSTETADIIRVSLTVSSPTAEAEQELLNWDKLLDLADRGLLAEGGGFAREHIQNLADDALHRLGKEVLTVHLPCFTYPVIWGETTYADSVAVRHMYATSPNAPPVLLAGADEAVPWTTSSQDGDDDDAENVEPCINSGELSRAERGGSTNPKNSITPSSSKSTAVSLMDVLSQTWYPDTGVDAHSGLGRSHFVVLVDHELESNFEHPAHLKYLKLQKGEGGEKEQSQGVLRPNGEELTRLNELVRRPKRTYSVEEKLLLYKFRHSLMDKKEALVKFLLVVDWLDAAEKKHALELMSQWQAIDTDDALALLSKDFRGVAEVRRYAVDRLENASQEELLGYLLQLVQALRYAPGNRGASGENDPSSEVAEGVAKDAFDNSGEADPLLVFLIHRAQRNVVLATYFHWFLIAEIEASDSGQFREGEAALFNAYIFVKARQQLLDSLEENQPAFAKIITDQITFRRKLLWAMRISKAQKRQNIELKIAKFQDALSGKQVPDPDLGDRMVSKQFQVLDLPMIVDPTKRLVRIIPSKCFLIKSAMYPAVLHCEVKDENEIVSLRKYMFKEGDDLRQDQLVLQMIILMDSLLKKYGLDLRLTPYQVIACSTVDGFIEFVPDAQNLSAVLAENNNDLWGYFKSISAENNAAMLLKTSASGGGGTTKGASLCGIYTTSTAQQGASGGYSTSKELNVTNKPLSSTLSSATSTASHQRPEVDPEILDNFVRSCAGYCVITYILGIGDRHLDNLMVSKSGQMFHIDFGYILGKDPKPLPPPMKLCREMVDGMGGKDSTGYQTFLSNACEAFKILRRHQNLVVNLLYLMSDAGIKDISQFALSKLQEKFMPEKRDEEAEKEFILLINESVNALFPQVLEKLHKWAVYWR